MKLLYKSSQGLEELIDITAEVNTYIKESGVENGTITIQTIDNTSAIVALSNQNGAPDKQLFATAARLYPLMDGMRFMGHEIKCVRSGIIGTAKTFIVSNGEVVLGAFEAIYLVDFEGPKEDIPVVLLATPSEAKVIGEELPQDAINRFREEFLKEKEEQRLAEERAIQEMREEWQREHANDPRFMKEENDGQEKEEKEE